MTTTMMMMMTTMTTTTPWFRVSSWDGTALKKLDWLRQ
jgi:hypothetical protein